MQLRKMFTQYQKGESDRDQSLEFQEYRGEEKTLTIRHGLGEISKETYELTLEHLNDQMQAIYI